MRVSDIEGTHCCARLIWNAGLPLLQPGLSAAVKRPFAAAARALEAAASPLHRLRAQLHLEVGKCEAAEDSQIKVGHNTRAWSRARTGAQAAPAANSPLLLAAFAAGWAGGHGGPGAGLPGARGREASVWLRAPAGSSRAAHPARRRAQDVSRRRAG